MSGEWIREGRYLVCRRCSWRAEADEETFELNGRFLTREQFWKRLDAHTCGGIMSQNDAKLTVRLPASLLQQLKDRHAETFATHRMSFNTWLISRIQISAVAPVGDSQE